MKSTPKIGLCWSLIDVNGSKATPATSGTNEDGNSFKETVEKIYMKTKTKTKKNDEGESLFDIIRNIVKEVFNSQEQHQRTNKDERLDKLSEEIVDLTVGLEFKT